MKKLLYLSLLLPLVLWAETEWKSENKEGFSALFKVSTDSTSVIESFRLNTTFNTPLGYRINEDELIQRLLLHLNPFEPQLALMGSSSSITKLGDQQQQIFDLELKALKPGTLFFSFLAIRFNPLEESGTLITLLSPIFSINAFIPDISKEPLLAPPLSNKIGKYPQLSIANRERFINAPQAVNQRVLFNQKQFQKRQFPWTATILFLLLILMIRFGRKIQKLLFSAFKKPKKEILPQTAALTRLAALKSDKVNEGSSIKETYLELTKIIRLFLKNKLRTETSSQTTEELIRSIKIEHALNPEKRKTLERILERADRIKFGPDQLMDSKINDDIRNLEKALTTEQCSKAAQPSKVSA